MTKKTASPEGAQFLRYFGPVLDALRALGGSGAPSEVIEKIVEDLKIPDSVQNELLDSGSPRFPNQVGWARYYLMREELIDSSERGVWSLTEKGHSAHVTYDQAREIFRKWVKYFADARKEKKAGSRPDEGDELAPEKTEVPATNFRDRLAEIFFSLPPKGFERLCQRLLRESGFVQVVVTGRSGDGGIDGYGTLQVNPLVSFKVLFQCKRLTSSVGSSTIRDFRGAMQGRADKGIILTTGTFTAEAKKEAMRDGVPPLELVDGQKLQEMFIQLELGLNAVKTYEVRESFFAEFRGDV
ncbi:MAG: restriction endonuclease [Gemmatimonadaceae bacterium]